MTDNFDSEPRQENAWTPRVSLVVGASRGIGHALTQALLDDSRVRCVLATHRRGSDLTALKRLADRVEGRLKLLELDVCDDTDLQAFGASLSELDASPDLAIHAAGLLHDGAMQPEKSLDQCRREHLLRAFEVNSIGPLLVAQALSSHVERKQSLRFVALSAMVGSIGDNRLGGWYGYRASKAALNQFVRTVANEWRTRLPRAVVAAMHPGTTDTELSKPFQSGVKPDKLYSAEQSAGRILSVIGGLGKKHSGLFFNWDGKEIPW